MKALPKYERWKVIFLLQIEKKTTIFARKADTTF